MNFMFDRKANLLPAGTFKKDINEKRNMKTNIKRKKRLQNKNRCPNCNSKNVVKCGSMQRRNGLKVQRYRCKKCNKRFKLGGEYTRLKIDEGLIHYAIDLHDEGYSFAKIRDILKIEYGVKVDRGSIWRWVKKYSKQINHPDLGLILIPVWDEHLYK